MLPTTTLKYDISICISGSSTKGYKRIDNALQERLLKYDGINVIQGIICGNCHLILLQIRYFNGYINRH